MPLVVIHYAHRRRPRLTLPRSKQPPAQLFRALTMQTYSQAVWGLTAIKASLLIIIADWSSNFAF